MYSVYRDSSNFNNMCANVDSSAVLILLFKSLLKFVFDIIIYLYFSLDRKTKEDKVDTSANVTVLFL